MTQTTYGNQESICDECGAPLLIDGLRGEAICRSCGLIMHERMAYPTRKHLGRTDNITSGYLKFQETAHQHGVPCDTYERRSWTGWTCIGTIASLAKIKNKRFQTMDKINRYEPTGRSRKFKERLIYLRIITSLLNLPNIIFETAKRLLYHVSIPSYIPQLSRNELIITCIFIACHEHQYPIFKGEFNEFWSKKSAKPFRLIFSYIRKFKKKIDFEMPIIRIEQYLNRICGHFLLPIDILKRGLALSRKIRTTKRPSIVAAAIVYYLCKPFNPYFTLEALSSFCHSSDVSIRHISKIFIEKFGEV